MQPPIGVFFETENIYTLNGNSEMLLSFMATMAQEESHNKSDIMNSSVEMRFRRGIFLTPPLLGYDQDADGNLIINETEAERTTGIILRSTEGIIEKNMIMALNAIKDMGVSQWVVVHAPEGGYGLNCKTGEIVKKKSLCLPEGYIKGTNGAGDAFCSGVLYAAYREKPLSEAIELGTACAACSLSEPGATEGMRSYDEVLKLYEKMK
jgi:hypothetical protein